MDKVLLHEAIKLNKARKRRMWWHHLVRSLAAVVIFCTTYALILPAITMTRDTICGMEEHTHQQSCQQIVTTTVQTCSSLAEQADVVFHTHDSLCYDEVGNLRCELEQLEQHTHTEDCFAPAVLICTEVEAAHIHTEECAAAKILSCQLVEEEGHIHGENCAVEKILSCQLAEEEGHTHSEACAAEKVLTCQLTEEEGHTHSENCEVEKILTCQLTEEEGHTHSENCEVEKILSCTLAEDDTHTHDDTCYIVSQCALEEKAGHTHDDSCYTVSQCALEEKVGHVHDDSCYTLFECTLEEKEGHIHNDSCYTVSQCTLEEKAGHTHDDSCYTLSECTLEESAGHAHTDACYEQVAEPICSQQEWELHTHTPECYDAEQMLICTKPQVISHQHEQACFTQVQTAVLVCEIPEHEHNELCYPVEETTPQEKSPWHCGSGVHTHSDSCLDEDGMLVCTIPEHTHDPSCLGIEWDPQADIQTQEQWEKDFEQLILTGNQPIDLLAVAKTQLGYTQSSKNCILEDLDLHYYTRYGDKYNDPYGPWNSTFVMFCMEYAEIEDFPADKDIEKHLKLLEEAGLFAQPPEYTPKPGDLLFSDPDRTDTTPEDEPVKAQRLTIAGNSTLASIL